MKSFSAFLFLAKHFSLVLILISGHVKISDRNCLYQLICIYVLLKRPCYKQGLPSESRDIDYTIQVHVPYCYIVNSLIDYLCSLESKKQIRSDYKRNIKRQWRDCVEPQSSDRLMKSLRIPVKFLIHVVQVIAQYSSSLHITDFMCTPTPLPSPSYIFNIL